MLSSGTQPSHLSPTPHYHPTLHCISAHSLPLLQLLLLFHLPKDLSFIPDGNSIDLSPHPL